jgi:hypothetical protein
MFRMCGNLLVHHVTTRIAIPSVRFAYLLVVPSGDYRVELVAGDPQYPTSTNTMQWNIEGTLFTDSLSSTRTLLNYTGTTHFSDRQWLLYSDCSTGTHHITDGKLTVSGGSNTAYQPTTKINYIIVTAVTSAAVVRAEATNNKHSHFSAGAVVGIVVAAVVVAVLLGAIALFVFLKARKAESERSMEDYRLADNNTM